MSFSKTQTELLKQAMNIKMKQAVLDTKLEMSAWHSEVVNELNDGYTKQIMKNTTASTAELEIL